MESKFCTHCNIEKQIKFFFKNYSKCKVCNSKRELKCYYENKDKTSNQQKKLYEKKRQNITVTK